MGFFDIYCDIEVWVYQKKIIFTFNKTYSEEFRNTPEGWCELMIKRAWIKKDYLIHKEIWRNAYL